MAKTWRAPTDDLTLCPHCQKALSWRRDRRSQTMSIVAGARLRPSSPSRPAVADTPPTWRTAVPRGRWRKPTSAKPNHNPQRRCACCTEPAAVSLPEGCEPIERHFLNASDHAFQLSGPPFAAACRHCASLSPNPRIDRRYRSTRAGIRLEGRAVRRAQSLSTTGRRRSTRLAR